MGLDGLFMGMNAECCKLELIDCLFVLWNDKVEMRAKNYREKWIKMNFIYLESIG